MDFIKKHLEETIEVIEKISIEQVQILSEYLHQVKASSGRLFVLGVGGSAANASHAVNDFRKLAGIESYAPTDNVAELSARTNDEGWNTVFEAWLKVSHLSENDALFILSVGGGDKERDISANLCSAIDYARSVSAKVLGIVGRDGGYTAKNADAVVIIPTVNMESVTPHAESMQAVIWHLLVSHPRLKQNPTKW